MIRPGSSHEAISAVKLSKKLTADVDAWSEAHARVRSDAIRQLVELGLSVASSAAMPGSTPRDRVKIEGLAVKQIDRLLDPSLPAEERERRTRRLTEGPPEFSDQRIDLPKPKKMSGTMAHNYAIDDDVLLQFQGPQGRDIPKQREVYTITARLPIEEDGRPGYRIRSKSEKVERVVTRSRSAHGDRQRGAAYAQLSACLHLFHDSRPTAQISADASGGRASRRHLAATSAVGRLHRRPDLFAAEVRPVAAPSLKQPWTAPIARIFDRREPINCTDGRWGDIAGMNRSGSILAATSPGSAR